MQKNKQQSPEQIAKRNEIIQNTIFDREDENITSYHVFMERALYRFLEDEELFNEDLAHKNFIEAARKAKDLFGIREIYNA